MMDEVMYNETGRNVDDRIIREADIIHFEDRKRQTERKTDEERRTNAYIAQEEERKRQAERE